MRHRRTIWLWTVFALVFSLFYPAAQAAWQCEGRTCGTSLWSCCCTSGAQAADDKCPSGQPAAAPQPGTPCPTECGCVLTVRAQDSQQPAHNLISVAPARASLPVEVLKLELPLRAGRIAPVEGRGPPPRPVTLEAPALRGPPSLPVSPVA